MIQENDTPRWQEEDSQTFIDYGRYFIPERETQIDIICSLIPAAPGQQHILDLCCGEGVLAGALLEHLPEYHVYGLDGSPTMLERAQTALRSYGGRFQTQLFDLAREDWRTFPSPVHAVVSSLAIHHLDAVQKQQLFRDIWRLLSPGGVFVIADVIQPITQLGVAAAAKMWDEAVRQRSLQLGGDLRAYQHFLDVKWNSFAYPEDEPDPVDKMSPLLDQLKWLEQAGFVDVDVFWVKAGHAIFGGSKRAEQ
jgi:tRNA (cmo5U34)-methyltransferase